MAFVGTSCRRATAGLVGMVAVAHLPKKILRKRGHGWLEVFTSGGRGRSCREHVFRIAKAVARPACPCQLGERFIERVASSLCVGQGCAFAHAAFGLL